MSAVVDGPLGAVGPEGPWRDLGGSINLVRSRWPKRFGRPDELSISCGARLLGSSLTNLDAAVHGLRREPHDHFGVVVVVFGLVVGLPVYPSR
jgi:hypothetical protein